MKSLRKRIDNMNQYFDRGSRSAQNPSTIRSAGRRMDSQRMTKALDETVNTRTTDKIKTGV